MRVQTPVAGFSGVVANVEFVDGAGETEDPVALAYFRRRGYLLGDMERPVEDDDESTESDSDDDAIEGLDRSGAPLDADQDGELDEFEDDDEDDDESTESDSDDD